VRRFLLVSCLISACVAPAAPLARPSDGDAVATSVPSLAPSPSASPTAEPSASPTAQPSASPTAAPAIADGPVRNDGKAILADISATNGTKQLYYGEGGGVAIVTQGSSYELNGTVLTGAAVTCTDTRSLGEQPTICVSVRILPTFQLVDGRRYTLSFAGDRVGSFVALGLELATPHVLAASATQRSLTVTFDRPMSHVAPCGGNAWNFYVRGTIEGLFSLSGSVFPPELASYTTTDPRFDAALRRMSHGTLADDCRAITFESSSGAAAGSYVLTIAGIEDEDGNLMRPASLKVTVRDEGPPSLVSARGVRSDGVFTAEIAFSEAMDEETVTDPERYQVSGRPLPDGASLTCEFADCLWVKLTMPAPAFAFGEDVTITVVGVTDTSTNAMVPDAATSRPFKVY